MDTALHDFITHLAHEAGDVLLGYFRSRTLRIDAKGTVDLVTEADRASEDVLIRRIRDAFPDHDILAEESGRSGIKSSYLWMLDPLEATYNFSRGLPIWGVNIALAHDGAVSHGAFFDPLLDELYYAERGHGATLNGRSIHTSGITDVAQAAVYCSTRRNVDVLSGAVRKFRHIGSIGNALAYVAAGYLDGAVEMGGGPWDYAAGDLLVREAGGQVSTLDGEMVSIETTTVLASATADLHGTLQPMLARDSR